MRRLLLLLACLLVLPVAAGRAASPPPPRNIVNFLSGSGSVAYKLSRSSGRQPREVGGPDDGGFMEGPAAGQAETSIAADATGKHVVVGYNDSFGFSFNPVTTTGFQVSDDGGVTWTTGFLPAGPTTAIGSTLYPQIDGDPDVKYLGGSTFVCFSLMAKADSGHTDNTICVHRSTDFGHTWQGPFEVTPATNPHGLLGDDGNSGDFADKEFADVDPDTGRVVLAWSNFVLTGEGDIEISVTFSDNLATATPPTWSQRVIVAHGGPPFGTGVIPRCAGHTSKDVYLAWSTGDSPGSASGPGSNIAFSRSADNGATWSAPISLTSSFLAPDQVLGNDRIHAFPAMAVDNSGGAHQGSLYVAYASDAPKDGADVFFQKSTDGGKTFSLPVSLSPNPANDRSQWFPWVAVDKNTGSVWVLYYDQSVAASGDLMEALATRSDDGGVTWSRPAPLSARPFHAGWGNDTGQPNLGDYNGAVAQSGKAFTAFGQTGPVGFADGQPSTKLTVPDVGFAGLSTLPAALRLGDVSFTEDGGNGNIDRGDLVSFTLPLANYVTNPSTSPGAFNGVQGTLSVSTPGVTVASASSAYPSIPVGSTAANTAPFVVRIGAGFVPGTPLELTLTVTTTGAGTAVLHTTQETGTPQLTTIYSEDFSGVAAGAVPPGWGLQHLGGDNTVPWTTRAFAGGSNGLFHADAADGRTADDSTRSERAFTPLITVPSGLGDVILDFDVAFNTEADPQYNVTAEDGFLLRLWDFTPGRTSRPVLAEAIAQDFTTGVRFHYPKHLPRSGDGRYFQDMSVWAGDSGGVQHVHMRLPGLSAPAGTTATQFLLVFEYTQTAGSPPANGGVWVDNLLLRGVSYVNPAPEVDSLAPGDAAVHGAAFTLNVFGKNFVPGAQVLWNGAARSTTFVAADQLKAAISADDLASAGQASVSVANPSPGGGGSNSVPFTIFNVFNISGTVTPSRSTPGPFAVAAVSPPPTVQTVNAGLAIPDNSTTGVMSTLNVTTSGTVGSLRVGVAIAHPRVGDLVVTLVHPDGTKVVLANRSGGAAKNLVTSYPDITAPSQSLGALAGKPIAGPWKLVVLDLQAKQVGRLAAWSLTVQPAESHTATVNTGADNTYLMSKVPAGTYQVTPAKTGVTFSPPARTVTIGPDAVNVDFSVVTAPKIASVKLTPASAKGGKVVKGKITLSAPAPPEGIVVQVFSTDPAAAPPPATPVQVAGKARSATFAIQTAAVPKAESVTLFAAVGRSFKTAVLRLAH